MFNPFKDTRGNFNSKRTLAGIVIILAVTFLVTYFLPPEVENYGVFSIAPAVFLIAYIFVTQRIVESLVLASLIGVIMVSRPVTVGEGSWIGNTFTDFSDSLLNTMMSEDIAWLIIVCGLMGSIISLIEKSGGAFAFGEWVAKRAKTAKSSLMWTWVLGIIIFIDDYLNSLTVGACMTPLTDRYKVPREFLAYVVDSTAAPLCVLIPISTWSVFCSRILETNDWAPAGEGLKYFIKTIPFNFYAWFAALIVPLAIFGIIPAIGPMKKAFKRVADGGPLAPEGSEKIDIHAGTEMEIPENPSIWNMVLPIAVLIIATIKIDMQAGVLITLAFMFVLYLAQGVVDAEEFIDVSLEGLKNMILPLILMVLAFLFADVSSQIHFTLYVIETATALVSPKFLPLAVFIALSITEFITGTNWGMYIIALPIVIPLAIATGADVTLAVAAVLSAGVFGSHICFYSDATVITSSATGCNNFDHAVTQLPYGLMASVCSAICFLIAGLLMN